MEIKETIMEHKELLIGIGLTAAAVALHTHLNHKRFIQVYNKGFDAGCDKLFAWMVTEFPDIDYLGFYKRHTS